MSYTEIETSSEIGEKDLEKSNTMSEKSGRTLQWVFNPVLLDMRWQWGNPMDTKSKSALCTTQSLAAEKGLRGTKPTQGRENPENEVGARSWS